MRWNETRLFTFQISVSLAAGSIKTIRTLNYKAKQNLTTYTVENLNVFSFNINRVSSVERARNAYTVHSTYACTVCMQNWIKSNELGLRLSLVLFAYQINWPITIQHSTFSVRSQNKAIYISFLSSFVCNLVNEKENSDLISKQHTPTHACSLDFNPKQNQQKHPHPCRRHWRTFYKR